jgi:threonylcarbamoyladenosine tRNA methylthiotransferase MtaB
LTPKMDLTALLEILVNSRLLRRIRLSSLDPREVPERLLELIAGSNVICPHLHICAQAGDDAILKQMRRNYDTSYYRDLLSKTRERLPEAALGSDIIVGFPGETDEQFEKSLAYFASLPLTYFHVFPYSERRGTASGSLPGPVHGAVKKIRAQRMRQLGADKKEQFCRSFLGRRMSVLVEEKVDRNSRGRRGFTRNYLPIIIHGGNHRVNQEVDVQIDGFAAGCLIGTVVEQRISDVERENRSEADA